MCGIDGLGIPGAGKVEAGDFQPGEPRENIHEMDGNVVEGTAVQAGFEVPGRTFAPEQGMLAGDRDGLDPANAARFQNVAQGEKIPAVTRLQQHPDPEIPPGGQFLDFVQLAEAGAKRLVGENVPSHERCVSDL